jgi:hypothetical protein
MERKNEETRWGQQTALRSTFGKGSSGIVGRVIPLHTIGPLIRSQIGFSSLSALVEGFSHPAAARRQPALLELVPSIVCPGLTDPWGRPANAPRELPFTEAGEKIRDA